MRTLRRVAVALLLVLVVALAIDRISLAVWKWRITRFAAILRAETAISRSELTARWNDGRFYTLNAQPPDPQHPHWWLTEVTFSRPGGIAPSMVSASSNGGISLRYFPPLGAWLWRLRAMAPGRNGLQDFYDRSCSIEVHWRDRLSGTPAVDVVEGFSVLF